MGVLPEVIDAEYRGGHKIHLTFNDGSARTIDFRPWLKKGPVFEALKDEAFFRRFFLDGGTVAWPNGTDIAPETLYGAPVIGGQPFESEVAPSRQPPRSRREGKRAAKPAKRTRKSR